MKAPLFEFPSFQYEISDWDFKKKGLLNRINKQKFVRNPHQAYETDRQTSNKVYVRYFEEFLLAELNEFCNEADLTCKMTDAWCVKYYKNDYQIVHNHRCWGFTGILYVDYDPKVHTPTCFLAPWQDPRSDVATLAYPQGVQEGVLFIAPSFTHHFVHPNKSNKVRTIISFDLLPKLPDHQSINIDE